MDLTLLLIYQKLALSNIQTIIFGLLQF